MKDVIKEYIDYFFNSVSCPKYIKKIGLLKEIIAIEARYARCKNAWQSHLEQCKKTIISEAEKLKNRDRIIILGAGSLHDVPLKELTELFNEVHLVDIFFLQSAINEIKRYDNVDFHDVDVTGVLEKAVSKIDSKGPLDKVSSELPKHFLQDENIDMVVSLNLLSQLPLSIKDYYLSKGLDLPNKFFQDLISNHIRYLRCFANSGSKVLLITDIEKAITAGNSSTTESSLENLDPSSFNGFKEINNWDWQLAPLGEISDEYSLELRVKAFTI